MTIYSHILDEDGFVQGSLSLIMGRANMFVVIKPKGIGLLPATREEPGRSHLRIQVDVVRLARPVEDDDKGQPNAEDEAADGNKRNVCCIWWIIYIVGGGGVAVAGIADCRSKNNEEGSNNYGEPEKQLRDTSWASRQLSICDFKARDDKRAASLRETPKPLGPAGYNDVLVEKKVDLLIRPTITAVSTRADDAKEEVSNSPGLKLACRLGRKVHGVVGAG